MATTLKNIRNPRSKIVSQENNSPATSATGNVTSQPFWEIIQEIGAQISDEEWAKVPQDASINYKHYLYGTPKKNG